MGSLNMGRVWLDYQSAREGLGNIYFHALNLAKCKLGYLTI